MIHKLRQRHRAMVYALGVLLPIGFLSGISARVSVPIQASEATRAHSNQRVLLERNDLWSNTIITRITTDPKSPEQTFVTLLPREPIIKPDVLLYWIPGGNGPLDSLPENAVLVGAMVNEVSLALPRTNRGESGSLLLYSLANHEIVAASKNFTPRR